jgi:hypothetical protein
MNRVMRMGVAAVALAVSMSVFAAEEDPYVTFIKTAPEFKPVKQDPAAWTQRWNTWTYMPWRFKWDIGTGDAGGQFCKDYGFNGGFTDHADTGVLPWLEKWNLLFYCDHLCGKGSVKVRARENKEGFKSQMKDGRSIRQGKDGEQQLNAAMIEKLEKMMDKRVAGLRKSPVRAAYALDDEISWGFFVQPICWRVNDDDAAYEKWLDLYYGSSNHPPAQYVSGEYTKAQLNKSIKDLDFSPLSDRITYNDGVWANFLGTLVEYSNKLDPETPCGFVGGQDPNMWGGYDYSKLCRKIQFIEAYLGTAQSLIRSFNPLIPQVTTHFHNDKLGTVNDIWQTWYCLSHGNRGMIGWVDGWFDGDKKPRPWLEEYKACNKEVSSVQGPKIVGAKFVHDGVAMYYSQSSLHVGWCLDMEAHGSTWTGRKSFDGAVGTWHVGRRAWEQILTDSGIQYNWVSYDEVAVNGVPKEYKVLILPSTFALSDAEAKRIREFVENGGTVIADFACGLFDQHAKGRDKGVLDDLFGVKHDGTESKKDFFAGGKLWTEINQDAAFQKDYEGMFKTQEVPLENGFAKAEKRLGTCKVNKVGKGTAVYLNLSPQRYHLYRQRGTITDEQRNIFAGPVLAAGVKPWVSLSVNGKRPTVLEATYFTKGDRTYVFVLQNVRITSSVLGDTKTEGLITGRLKVDVELPAAVKDVVDERAGKKLGDGKKFTFEFDAPEAAFFSYAGKPLH